MPVLAAGSAESRAWFSLVAVMGVFAAYSVISFNSSMWSSGVVGADRSNVYVLLVILMALQFLYVFRGRRTTRASWIGSSLVVFGGWILAANYLTSGFSWLAIVQTGLVVWWIATYMYFSRLSYRSRPMHKTIPSVMRWTFLLYLLAVIYSQVLLRQTLDTSVTNVIYYPLALAPFVLMWNRNAPRWVLLVLLILITFGSFKRGAIIALAVMLIVYLITQMYCSGGSPRSWAPLLIVPIIIYGVVRIVDARSQGFLAYRFEQENLASGSGRREIYAELWSSFSRGSFTQKLIGRGSDTPLELVGHGSHNDIIGVAISFGWIGLSIFIVLLAGMAHQVWTLVRQKHPLAPAAAATLAATFVVMTGSGFIFVHSSFFTFAFFGYVGGRLQYEKSVARTRAIGLETTVTSQEKDLTSRPARGEDLTRSSTN